MTEMRDLSLAEFASFYRIVRGHQKNNRGSDSEVDDDEEQGKVLKLRDDLGFVTKRRAGKEAVIRFVTIREDDQPERHFQNLLTLYLPHESKDFKPDDYDSYAAFYKDGHAEYKGQIERVESIVLRKKAMFERSAEEVLRAFEAVREGRIAEDVWAEIAPEAEMERGETTEPNPRETEELDMSDLPDLQALQAGEGRSARVRTSVEESVLTIPTLVARQLMKCMNVRQRRIFGFVRDWCTQKARGEKVAPFHVFLTGGAGTGKSHVIKAILYEASKILARLTSSPDEETVLLVAPTGTAAFNIGGRTVHSAFNIPAMGLSSKYTPLGEDLLTALRSKYGELQLLIIDEVSMVSKGMMNFITGRLDQIKRNQGREWFGGVSVLAVGDFYQIPPVGGRMLLTKDTKVFGEPWDAFSVFSLTEVMRQQDDKVFAEMLNTLRMRSAKEALATEHQRMLQSRLGLNIPQEALHIFSLRESANVHNNNMLYSLPVVKHTIEAVDVLDSRGGKKRKHTGPISVDCNLPNSIALAEGCRVMMTSNIDVLDGLVNGVMGTVVKIIEGAKPLGQPQAIAVRFDNERVGRNSRAENPGSTEVDTGCVLVQAHTEQISHRGQKYTRHQFPLKLCWACTIHKVQGMTLPQIVVSMEGIFKPGMGYVALSRVTSLDGLFLKDLDTKYIYCDKKVKASIESMPEKDLSDTLPLCNMAENKFVVVFHNVQGLSSKVDDIVANPEMKHANIIAVSETWQNQNNVITLPGYCAEVQSRVDGDRGGGGSWDLCQRFFNWLI